jgi:isovaleryl-CoA dehydrogenase
MYTNGLTFPLGDEVEALRDMVRRFAQERIAPIAAEIDRQTSFQRICGRRLGELGLLGITADPDFRRLGHGLCRPRRRHGGNLARVGLGRPVLRRAFKSLRQPDQPLGHAEQKEKFLPALCSGDHVGALAMSESAPAPMSCRCGCAPKSERPLRAQRHQDVDHQRPDADTLVVYAKTDPEEFARHHRLCHRNGMPGFSVAQKLDKLGMRGSNTGELVFENVEVPFDNVLHEEGRGVEVLMSGLDYERTVLAGGPLGIMAACMDVVVPYVHERKQFGQPIGEFQLVQGKLADMYTTMNACRAYVYAVAPPATGARRPARTPPAASSTPPRRPPDGARRDPAARRQRLHQRLPHRPPAARRQALRDRRGTSEIRRWLIGREIMAEGYSRLHRQLDLGEWRG